MLTLNDRCKAVLRVFLSAFILSSFVYTIFDKVIFSLVISSITLWANSAGDKLIIFFILTEEK